MSGAKRLSWDPAFNLGVDSLDEDHRRVMDFVNEINDLVQSQASVEPFRALLKDLIAHLKKHFEREERLIAQLDVSMVDSDHERSHESALAFLESMQRRYQTAPESVDGRKLQDYLHNWFLDHVLSQDHALLPAIELAGLRQTGGGGEETGLTAWLDNLSLSVRISALAIIPLLVVLYFSFGAIRNDLVVSRNMATMVHIAGMARDIGNLVHELQKERGASAGFLGSKGRQFRDKMLAQRRVTDGVVPAARQVLERGVGLGLGKWIRPAEQQLDQMAGVRRRVTNQSISLAEEVAYYTQLNALLLDIINQMSTLSHNVDLTTSTLAYVYFLQGKERAGLERAKGSVGFARGRFSTALYQDFVRLIAMQNSYLQMFRGLADREALAFADKALRGPESRKVDQMRQTALDSPDSGSTNGISGGDWFDAITRKINRLKEVEDYLANGLRKKSERIGAIADRDFYILAALTAVVMFLVVVAAVILILSVVKPLLSLRRSLDQLGDGDTKAMVSGLRRQDEIGIIARAVQKLKGKLLHRNVETARHDIDQSIRDRSAMKRDQLTEQFRAEIKGFLTAIGDAVDSLKRQAATLTEAMDRSRGQAAKVASASAEATRNVETVATATEELTLSIQEIGRQVEHSTQIADKATATTDQARETISHLAENAAKIGDIINLITNIAQQTNLLALNATIEAARAGDAGKGFAVVASEVKTLADQTAKATEDITQQVNTIQATTDTTVSDITEVAGIIAKLREATTSIAAAIEEQGAATQEISTNVAEAAKGTQDVSHNIEGVAGSTERSSEASGRVLEASQQVDDQAKRIRNQVQDYLESMQTA